MDKLIEINGLIARAVTTAMSFKHRVLKAWGSAVLFCLLCNLAVGQASPPPAGNTSHARSGTSWAALNERYNNPMVVLDDKLIPDSSAKRVLDKLNPYAVIKITVLHQTAPKRNTIYLTTKDARIAVYQKKLGAFSKEYRDYLATHQNIDGHFIYSLNAVPLQGDHTGIIDVLYKIPADKITAVSFNGPTPADTTMKMVMIYTKQ